VVFSFFYLANAMLNNIKQSNASVVLFFLSFTVLFSFFQSIYSYDEPIQYCLVAISLLAILKKNWVIYILSFSIGLIVRESGVLLIPSIAFFLIPIDFKFKSLLSFENIKKGLIILLPVFIYMAYLYLFITMSDIAEESKSDLTDRFSHFIFNFHDKQHAFESIIPFFLAIGLTTVLLYWFQSSNELKHIEKQFIKSFLLCLILNSVIVFATTKAREARLFALPLVFLWPLLGKYLLSELKLYKNFSAYNKLFRNRISLLMLSFLTLTSAFIFIYVYNPTSNWRAENFQDEYMLLVMITVSFHFVFKNHLKKDKNILE
jgi:hypothetical protein